MANAILVLDNGWSTAPARLSSFPARSAGEVARSAGGESAGQMREIEKKAMARRLRKALTPAEALMWWRLRRDFDGWRFRRQHPVGPYIADFACIEARLVIEIDGATHGTQDERAYDERRTRFIEAGDWRVIRFTNEEVERSREGVRTTIPMALQEQAERLRSRRSRPPCRVPHPSASRPPSP